MIAQDGSTSQSRYYDNFFSRTCQFPVIFRRYTNTILVFQKAENLICVTEDKPEQNLIEGLAQNIKQLESSCQTNLRKWKRNDDDDFDYDSLSDEEKRGIEDEMREQENYRRNHPLFKKANEIIIKKKI